MPKPMRIALRLNLDGSSELITSPGNMSPGMQRIYERTARRFSAHRKTTTGSNARIIPKLNANVTINGREFHDTDEMPPEYQRFYEQILAQALPVQRAIDIVARAERTNFIARTITLGFVLTACVSAIVYLWLHGYYG